MSLKQTYQSRKQLLVQNLETMGVTGYTEDDGLTTLINAVLEIAPTPTPTVDSLTLAKTAGKQILSYADSGASPETEYCTVTATALDSNNQGVSGQSVVFKVGTTTVATETTDSNGEASYTYTSQGSGDVVLSAECSSLIQTYAIEDCNKYLASYSHTYQGRLTSGNYGTLIYELNSLTDLEITAKVKTSYIYGYAFGLSSKTGNANVESDWGDYIRMFVGNGGKVGMAYLNNGATDSVTSNYSPSANTFHNWKITYEDGAFKAYHENNLIGTLNTNLPSASKKVVLQLWNDGKTVTIEDLKVKPL